MFRVVEGVRGVRVGRVSCRERWCGLPRSRWGLSRRYHRPGGSSFPSVPGDWTTSTGGRPRRGVGAFLERPGTALAFDSPRLSAEDWTRLGTRIAARMRDRVARNLSGVSPRAVPAWVHPADFPWRPRPFRGPEHATDHGHVLEVVDHGAGRHPCRRRLFSGDDQRLERHRIHAKLVPASDGTPI